MSTRSGKRIHCSPQHENNVNYETSRKSIKTRSKHINKDSLEEQLAEKKQKKHYVKYPSEETLDESEDNSKSNKTLRKSRRNTLKERNINNVTVEENELKHLKTTRRTNKCEDVDDNEVASEKKNKKKSKKIKITRVINKNNLHLVNDDTIAVSKKKSNKKKIKKKSNSMIVEDVIEQANVFNTSQVSEDSFHSAAGSPKANEDLNISKNRSTPKHTKHNESMLLNKSPIVNSLTKNKLVDPTEQQNYCEVMPKSGRLRKHKFRTNTSNATVEIQAELADDCATKKSKNVRKKKRKSSTSFEENNFISNVDQDILTDRHVNSTFDRDDTHSTIDQNKKTNTTLDVVNGFNSTLDKEDETNSTFNKKYTNNKFDKKDNANSTFDKEDNANSTFDKKDNTNSTFDKKDNANSTFDKKHQSNSTFDKKDNANSTYDKKENANSTFDKKDQANNTFDKKDNANSTFDIKDNANSTFDKKDNANSTCDKKDYANSTFDKIDNANSSFYKKGNANSTFDKKDNANSTFDEKDNANTFDNKDNANSTFDKKDRANSTFDKRDSANSTFEKKENANSTFDKKDNANSTFGKKNNANSTFDKKDNVDSTFDKEEECVKSESTKKINKKETAINEILKLNLNMSKHKNSATKKKKSINIKNQDKTKNDSNISLNNISNENSNDSILTSDSSKSSHISVTSDESHSENILNKTPLLVESSLEEEDISESTINPEQCEVSTTTPLTPLKREGTFTKDSPGVNVVSKNRKSVAKTPTRRKSLPSPGCTPFPLVKSISRDKSILNLTHSVEKRRSSIAERAPRATKVMFCSPANNPVVVSQMKGKVIKSNIKGSNKSFIFDDNSYLSPPHAAGRKRSQTAAGAEPLAKRSRLAEPAASSPRLRTRTVSAGAKLSVGNESQRADSPARDGRTRTKLPNFAALHARQFARMESLDECQRRRAERARLLLTPPTRAAAHDRLSTKENQHPKQLESITKKPETPTKVKQTPQPTYSRFGFKLQGTDGGRPFSFTASKVTAKAGAAGGAGLTRQATMPSMAGTTRKQLARQTVMREKHAAKRDGNRQESRTVIKGVRTNRRFELQMKMRNVT